jgi:hypothetical protein
VTDLEMTKLCAEAMGWKHLGAVGHDKPERHATKPYCLFGCNDWWLDPSGYELCCGPCQMHYDPLHHDAQAMALVKRFELQSSKMNGDWCVAFNFSAISDFKGHHASKVDLNRAIVECVAKMQAAK